MDDEYIPVLLNKRKLKSFSFASNICSKFIDISNTNQNLFEPPDELDFEKEKLKNIESDQLKKRAGQKRQRQLDDEDDIDEDEYSQRGDDNEKEKMKKRKTDEEKSKKSDKSKKLIIKKSDQDNCKPFKEVDLDDKKDAPFGAKSKEGEKSSEIKYDSIPAMGRRYVYRSLLLMIHLICLESVISFLYLFPL